MGDDSRHPEGGRGRWARYTRAERQTDPGSPFTLSETDTVVQQEHFGVARDQIEHDFVISHVLAALAARANQFVFYGGTALSRTFLEGLRLSEDIDWPRQLSEVSQRYAGLPNITLTTYTAEGFAGAKTAAWCDTTRNAPRDLYDLWAMADVGLITANAAVAYRKHGPTSGFPQRGAFPTRPPSETEWHDALGHQCNPRVGPVEAYETVVAAWEAAVNEADHAT